MTQLTVHFYKSKKPKSKRTGVIYLNYVWGDTDVNIKCDYYGRFTPKKCLETVLKSLRGRK